MHHARLALAPVLVLLTLGAGLQALRHGGFSAMDAPSAALLSERTEGEFATASSEDAGAGDLGIKSLMAAFEQRLTQTDTADADEASLASAAPAARDSATDACAKHAAGSLVYYYCFGTARIAELLAVLRDLRSGVENSTLGASVKTTLLNEIGVRLSGLLSLRQKLVSDYGDGTNIPGRLEKVRQDVSSISTDFRVSLTSAKVARAFSSRAISEHAVDMGPVLAAMEGRFGALASSGVNIGAALTRINAARDALDDARSTASRAYLTVAPLQPDKGDDAVLQDNNDAMEESRTLNTQAKAGVRLVDREVASLEELLNSLSRFSVSIKAPSIASGIVRITAVATGTRAIESVTFRNGSATLGRDLTAPYAVEWDTANTPNGTTTLTAIARDSAGREQTAKIQVQVKNKESFRILWAINTQVEPLADPTTVQQAEIAELKKKVDGYSLNVLAGGMLAYWPERPYRCALNKQTNPEDEADPALIRVNGTTYTFENLWNECGALYDRYTRSLPKPHGLVHEDAVGRALANLGIKAEQAEGKTVNAQTIVPNSLFTYVRASDTIVVNSLPKSLKVFQESGITTNTLFIYQERTRPEQMLQVPVTKGTSTIEYLPDNVRMIGMISRALATAGYPIKEFLLNIRSLQDGLKESILSIKNNANFGGLTFEGGVSMLDPHRTKGIAFNERVEQIAWALRSTGKDVYLLMPANWQCPDDSCAETNSAQSRAVLIERLKDFIRKLDVALKQKGVLTGVCNDRLFLEPGAYGRPLHPPQLPIRLPDGTLAGTVGGELVALYQLRAALCGS